MEYVVSFSYVVRRQAFEGRYRVNSPEKRGHCFEILYDPKRPSRNTASDTSDGVWLTWGMIVGIGATMLALWQWTNKIGFKRSY